MEQIIGIGMVLVVVVSMLLGLRKVLEILFIVVFPGGLALVSVGLSGTVLVALIDRAYFFVAAHILIVGFYIWAAALAALVFIFFGGHLVCPSRMEAIFEKDENEILNQQKKQCEKNRNGY